MTHCLQGTVVEYWHGAELDHLGLDREIVLLAQAILRVRIAAHRYSGRSGGG